MFNTLLCKDIINGENTCTSSIFFCLQYKEWKDKIAMASYSNSLILNQNNHHNKEWQDPTGDISISIEEAKQNCKLVEDSSDETDPYLGEFIFKAVTENCSYVYLKTAMLMPCGKDLFYKMYHKFFWVLDKKRSHILQRV